MERPFSSQNVLDLVKSRFKIHPVMINKATISHGIKGGE